MKLMLDKQEAADALSISVSMLERLTSEGQISKIYLGSRVLYRATELERFADQLAGGQVAQKKRGRPRLAV